MIHKKFLFIPLFILSLFFLGCDKAEDAQQVYNAYEKYKEAISELEKLKPLYEQAQREIIMKNSTIKQKDELINKLTSDISKLQEQIDEIKRQHKKMLE